MSATGSEPGICPEQPPRLSRRAWLRAAAAGGLAGRLAGAAPAAWSHANAGRVEPRQPVPPLQLRLHDGRTVRVAEHLRGRVTALQLMFTGCRSTCPIQGAQFAQVQQQVRALPPSPGRAAWQMLSVSVDALGDDPARVAQWLARWGAGPSWQGGVVQSEQLDQWLAYLSPRTGPADAGKARAPTERHSAQVFLFDAQARLAWRSTDLPAPEGVAQTLRELLRG